MDVQINPEKIQLTSFQQQALQKMSNGKDVLMVAPSSTGKTFITKIYLLNYFRKHFNTFLNSPRKIKVCFLFPYKSVAIQEYEKVQTEFSPYGLKTLLTVGGVQISENDILDSNIFIGTYEKFLVCLKKHPILVKYLKIMAIDEFHFLSSNRGTVLEELVLSYHFNPYKNQLVLLSSTIDNPIELSDWLDLELIIANKRPVPIQYQLEYSSSFIKSIKNIVLRSLPVLIFCGSRYLTENLAMALYQHKKNTSTKGTDLNVFLEDLKLSNDQEVRKIAKETYLPPKLRTLVKHSIGYHHAGLSDIIRLLVEELYLDGKIDFLFATSTLAAGVNLPAQVSIYIHTTRIMKDSNNLVFQILGRAGRWGFQNKGTGIILSNRHINKARIREKLFKKAKNTSREKSVTNKPQLIPKYDEIKSKFGNYAFLCQYYLNQISYSKASFSNDIENLLGQISNSFWFYKNKHFFTDNTVPHINLYSSIASNNSLDEILKYYEKLDQVFDKKTSQHSVKIISLQQTKMETRAVTREGTKTFKTFLSPAKNSCTCQSIHSNYICKHQRFVLAQLPNSIYLSSYGIIDFLVNNGFIIRSHDNKLNATLFGKVCSFNFLHPYDFLDYVNFFNAKEKISFMYFMTYVIDKDQQFSQEIQANELLTNKALSLIEDIWKNGMCIIELSAKYHISDSTIANWNELIEKFFRVFNSLTYLCGKNEDNTTFSEEFLIDLEIV